MEEERSRLMEQTQRRLQLLREALMKDEEDEERRMKEESAEQLRSVPINFFCIKTFHVYILMFK